MPVRLRLGVMCLCVAVFLPGRGEAQDSLRVLTWNIQLLPTPARSVGRPERAKVIADQLKARNYDVVVFQEAFHKKGRKILIKELSAKYPYRTDVLNKKAIALKTNGGVILFSRYPIAKTSEIRFKKRSGIDKMSRKGALLAELNINGKAVQVAGTHLQAFGADEIMYAQYEQIKQELIARHQRPGVPQLICGDFNTLKQVPDTIPAGISPEMIRRLPRYERMLTVLDAKDGPLAGPQQFTMDRPFNDMCVTRKEFRLLLDYILLRPNGFENLSIHRRVRIIRHPWHADHQDLSDHFGLEAVLTW